MNFRLPCLLVAAMLLGCQTAAPTPKVTATPTPGMFTNKEYGYQFEYPIGAEVEITSKSGSEIKVHAGIDDPFEITATRDYFPLDASFYLDTKAAGERTIGDNHWLVFVLPEGYCDASICSLPIYALRMEAGDVLYTITFYSQDTTTELQEQILTTFTVSAKH